MKIHRVELYVVDFENLGADSIKRTLENNRGISVQAEAIDTVDIGEWHDDHPLNKDGVSKKQYFNDKIEEIPV